MARVLGVLLAGLSLLLVFGLLFPAIYSGRATTDRLRCTDHLRSIGAFGTLHTSQPATGLPAAKTEFPAGTVPASAPEVEDRLSLYAGILSGLRLTEKERQQTRAAPFLSELSSLDLSKPWNDPVHDKLARTRISVLICPGNVPPANPAAPASTMYLGNGGIGADAPTKAIVDNPKSAGVFRYDTPTLAGEVTDGLSHTIQIGEVSEFGNPWMRGGPSTVLAVDADGGPWLGGGRNYGGNHRGGAMFSFADGSARFLTTGIAPGIFKAMLTIAGNETDLVE